MNNNETKTEAPAKWEGNFSDIENFGEILENHKESVIPTPIFIIFAEYMGYISQFNKMAEGWCDGKVPEVHVQKIMILEAKCIYRQMLKDYDINEVKYYYDSYYPLILKEYMDKLDKVLEDDDD